MARGRRLTSLRIVQLVLLEVSLESLELAHLTFGLPWALWRWHAKRTYEA